MRIAFHTLGCKVNQYETEAMKEAFVLRDAEIVSEEEPADVYVVNTCTVTNIADRKSRQYIRRMKKLSPDALMVVTGCYAQVAADEVASIEEVDLVIGNGLKSGICDAVFKAVADNHVSCAKNVLERSCLVEYEDMGLVESSESGLTRAYVKIQEGCDRFCSYCMIPFARGTVRSRSVEDVVLEARTLIDKGFREIVLTGINTALYGTEEGFCYERIDGEDGFSPMEVILSRINAIDGDFRMRLSSLEPTVVDKEHVEKIIRFDKLCHHLHLSVQSGSTSVISRMNRHYTREEYLEIVKAIRAFNPLYGLTTDIIVGFPGETEEEFEDSVSIVREACFEKVHAFRYSRRKGTRADAMKDQIPGIVKSDRIERLMNVADEVSHEFERMNFETVHKVLSEERVGDFVTGYTDNYIKVYIEDRNHELKTGEFCYTKLTGFCNDGCTAVVVEKGR